MHSVYPFYFEFGFRLLVIRSVHTVISFGIHCHRQQGFDVLGLLTTELSLKSH